MLNKHSELLLSVYMCASHKPACHHVEGMIFSGRAHSTRKGRPQAQTRFSYSSTCHCATRFSNNLNRVALAVCHVMCWALGSRRCSTQPLQLLGRGENQSYHHRDKPKIPVLKESVPGLIKGSFRRFWGFRLGEKAQGSNFCKMIIIFFMCLLPPLQYQESKWESC